jgi:RNA polymerase sigma-70 factor (ECF subfamily)
MNEVTKTTAVTLEFNAIYKEFKPAIIAHLRTKIQNEEERDDIEMRVWDKLNRHLECHVSGAYNPIRGKMNTWLFTIVKNEIIDYFRSDRYKKHEMLTTKVCSMVNEENENINFQFVGEGTASTTMENNELSDKILTAFDKIKPTYKDIAIQYFLHEKKYDEIAVAMSIPLNTVKVAILRAREVLQNNLKAEYASM